MLLKFRAFQSCPKCKHLTIDVKTQYCEKAHDGVVVAHLHRVCDGCGFEWLERTADAV